MKHLREDDLVLYHYGEIRTAPASEHLSACRGCRDRLEKLSFDVEKPSPRLPKGTLPLPIWRRLLLLLAPAGAGRRG